MKQSIKSAAILLAILAVCIIITLLLPVWVYRTVVLMVLLGIVGAISMTREIIKDICQK